MGIFMFNGRSSDEFGIYVAEKDIHSAPARDQSFISVPGRNGDVLIDNGRYENVTVSYTCYCKNLVDNMYLIKSWLCQSGYFLLEDSYFPFFYRYAAFASNLKVEELINNVGKFTITFNCKPFQYLVFGLLKYTFTNSSTNKTITNSLEFSALPVIKIYGTGSGTLHINSRSYALTDISEYIEINSELMSCYKDDTLQNNKINFAEFPYLEPGDNALSWTGDITKVEITPNWRTL
ncbi:MAG: phage tail family protein [Eubacterium sp.]|nr:phage tail family protein [Eubacterium sp.]